MDQLGRLGLLTNIFTGSGVDPSAAGRGRLVVDWLAGTTPPDQYLTRLQSSQTLYNPFNLVLLDRTPAGQYQVLPTTVQQHSSDGAGLALQQRQGGPHPELRTCSGDRRNLRCGQPPAAPGGHIGLHVAN